MPEADLDSSPLAPAAGKTQLKDYDSLPTLEELPLWGFDGSSTQQAEGHSSDCVLKPVAVYPDGARTNGLLVLCEVSDPYQIASQILKNDRLGAEGIREIGSGLAVAQKVARVF